MTLARKRGRANALLARPNDARDPFDVGGGKAPYSFNQIKMDPNNPDRLIITSDQMYVSEDGGRTWSCSNSNGFFRGVFGDFRAMWWDAEDANRIMIGSDGGLNVSYDGGRTADYFPNMRIGEFYAIGVDMDDPYNVYGGMQDHDSWKGPSNGPSGRITLEHWTTVGPGDGMYNQVDPTDSRWVYNTREMGNHGRFDQRTGQRTVIAPPAPQGRPRGRYIWAAPIVLSPHNPQIVYAGAEVLFRSLNRGDMWEQISGDLTTNETGKCGNNSGNVPYCAITTISESPLRAGTIWIGTDDGKVQLTQNHGATWTDLTPALVAAGAPVDRYVTRVFASPHDASTAFVAKSGLRHDDFTPYLYRTTDAGKTWTSIGAGLAVSPINVVVQDRKNANLLIVGNDMGVYVSIDSGKSWARLKANLPTVAVHDLTIHPRENALVLGTYGRAIWVGDISPLLELSADVLARPAHLFDIEPRARYGFAAIGNYNLYGDKYIEIPNEPEALIVNYHLRADAAGYLSIGRADERAIRRSGFTAVQFFQSTRFTRFTRFTPFTRSGISKAVATAEALPDLLHDAGGEREHVASAAGRAQLPARLLPHEERGLDGEQAVPASLERGIRTSEAAALLRDGSRQGHGRAGRKRDADRRADRRVQVAHRR